MRGRRGGKRKRQAGHAEGTQPTATVCEPPLADLREKIMGGRKALTATNTGWKKSVSPAAKLVSPAAEFVTPAAKAERFGAAAQAARHTGGVTLVRAAAKAAVPVLTPQQSRSRQSSFTKRLPRR